MANICVFCSASDKIPEVYKKAARELGELLGKRGHNVVYGGGNPSMMGIVAKSTQSNGGKAIGIVPRIWKHLERIEDEYIAAEDLRHRKTLYEMNSDAFIALPGGLGTLDEIFDTLVCRQIDIHQKPLAIVNTNNFFEYLKQHIDKTYQEGFIEPKHRVKYSFVNTPLEAITYVEKHLAPLNKLKQQQ